MKILYFLFFVLFLLAWCWKQTSNLNQENKKRDSISYTVQKKTTESNTGSLGIYTSNGKFDLYKYKAWIERDLFLWDQKVLSWMNQVLQEVKSNIQVLDQQSLEEFKKMLALHQENLSLMKQLVDLQKKRYDCFIKIKKYKKPAIPLKTPNSIWKQQNNVDLKKIPQEDKNLIKEKDLMNQNEKLNSIDAKDSYSASNKSVTWTVIQKDIDSVKAKSEVTGSNIWTLPNNTVSSEKKTVDNSTNQVTTDKKWF